MGDGVGDPRFIIAYLIVQVTVDPYLLARLWLLRHPHVSLINLPDDLLIYVTFVKELDVPA